MQLSLDKTSESLNSIVSDADQRRVQDPVRKISPATRAANSEINSLQKIDCEESDNAGFDFVGIAG